MTTPQKQADSALKLITTTTELPKKRKISLWELYLEFAEGRLLSLNKWLQRLEKQHEWTKTDYRKAKSYIHSCIDGVGTLQEFIIIPIAILIVLVKEHCSMNKKPSKIYKDILMELEEMQTKGCVNICLDGQNRGKHAIVPFFENLFPLDELAVKTADGTTDWINETLFEDLPSEIQEQIRNIQVKITTIDYIRELSNARDVVIYKNEGIAWTPHEKRITSFTDVSYALTTLSLHPVITEFYSKLAKDKLLGSEYKLDKKGDTFMMSEYLFYLVNGSFGTQERLDSFFEFIDVEDLTKISKHKEILLYLAEQYNKDYINLWSKKSLFDDIFMFFANLLDENNDIGISFKNLDDKTILKPKEFFKIICQKLENRYHRKIDWDPTEEKALPGTFAVRHNGKSTINLKERLKVVNNLFIPVVEKFIENKTIIPFTERVYISKKQQAEVLKQQDYKWLGEPVVLSDSELDHEIPLSKGGTNDVRNLRYVPKKWNREKSDKIV